MTPVVLRPSRPRPRSELFHVVVDGLQLLVVDSISVVDRALHPGCRHASCASSCAESRSRSARSALAEKSPRRRALRMTSRSDMRLASGGAQDDCSGTRQRAESGHPVHDLLIAAEHIAVQTLDPAATARHGICLAVSARSRLRRRQRSRSRQRSRPDVGNGTVVVVDVAVVVRRRRRRRRRRIGGGRLDGSRTPRPALRTAVGSGAEPRGNRIGRRAMRDRYPAKVINERLTPPHRAAGGALVGGVGPPDETWRRAARPGARHGRVRGGAPGNEASFGPGRAQTLAGVGPPDETWRRAARPGARHGRVRGGAPGKQNRTPGDARSLPRQSDQRTPHAAPSSGGRSTRRGRRAPRRNAVQARSAGAHCGRVRGGAPGNEASFGPGRAQTLAGVGPPDETWRRAARPGARHGRVRGGAPGKQNRTPGDARSLPRQSDQRTPHAAPSSGGRSTRRGRRAPRRNAVQARSAGAHCGRVRGGAPGKET